MSIAIVICLWRQARLMVAQQQSGQPVASPRYQLPCLTCLPIAGFLLERANRSSSSLDSFADQLLFERPGNR